MSTVVGIERLTIYAKVLGAECTAVPLSNDPSPGHVSIAERKAMFEVTEISCFDVDEQMPLHNTSERVK